MSFLQAMKDFSVLTTFKNQSSLEQIFTRINSMKKEKHVLEEHLKLNPNDLRTNWKINNLNNALTLESSTVLDLAKQTIMSFAKGFGKVHDGRAITGRLKVRPVIILSRNQALHFDEKNYESPVINIFKKMYNKKLISNPDVKSKNFAFEIINNVLQWSAYDDMYKDLVEINGTWTTKELVKRLLWLKLWNGKNDLLSFYKFPFIKRDRNQSKEEKKLVDELEHEWLEFKKFLRFPKWQQEVYSQANQCKEKGRQKKIKLEEMAYLNCLIDSYLIHRIKSALDKEGKKFVWIGFKPLHGNQILEGKIIAHRSRPNKVGSPKSTFFEYWFVDSNSPELRVYILKSDTRIEYDSSLVKISGELGNGYTSTWITHQVFKEWRFI